MHTIRFRVVALATVVVLGVLVTASVVLVLVQRRALTESLDEALGRRAQEIASLVATKEVSGAPSALGDEDTIIQLVASDGTVLWSTAPGENATESSGLRVQSRDVSEADDRRVVVAGTMDDVNESTRVLAVSLALVVPVVVAVVAWVMWWLIGRTLRPVEAIRAEVATISGSKLHRRVPEPDTGDEIARLAITMNAMLDRVAQSAERQQRFVADASHELRSPLTRMRTQLEVDIAHPDSANRAESERSVLEETIGMQRLVDDLLRLARHDDGAESVDHLELLDLDDLLLRQAARLRAQWPVEVQCTVDAIPVRGDLRALDRAIGNVTDNAARHADSLVVLTLSQRDSLAILTVADDGPGVPRPDCERVFERFARVDDARARSSGGAGLGLAIARDIIQRHGGTIEIDPTCTSGTRVVVQLPAVNAVSA